MSFEKTYQRHDCRFCGGDELRSYLDLGAHPVSNGFINPEDIARERRYPLEVLVCLDCGASQLSQVVAAKALYGDYSYLSSTSRPLVAHYQALVDVLIAVHRPKSGAVVVDIGANDGIMLRRYPTGSFRLVGVEPSSAGNFARVAGLDIIARFFDGEVVDEILDRLGPASIVTATNVFAHIDDIAGFCRQLARLLAPDGVAVIEFPYVIDTIEGLYFDTVYHEHLSYLGATPVARLADRTGLALVDAQRVEFGASGPALRLTLARRDGTVRPSQSVPAIVEFEARWGLTREEPYRGFADEVASVKRDLTAIIDSVVSSGRALGAYSAPAKGNTLLNYLNLAPGTIRMVAENNPEKIGKVTPGTHIPVVSDADFEASGIDRALLLSWNYADFFIANAEFVKRGGKFIIPLPAPRLAP